MLQDDRYFLSGSLDGKIRLWNIPDKKVALWNELEGTGKTVCVISILIRYSLWCLYNYMYLDDKYHCHFAEFFMKVYYQ